MTRDGRNLDRRSARVTEWVSSLPDIAADTVSGSDISQPHIYSQFNASRDQLSVVRAQMSEWAQQTGVQPELVQDMVLAVDEAVSNAIEHAYPGRPGSVTLFAACQRLARAVRVVVSDTGTWQRPALVPGVRGRGVAMMQSLAGIFHLSTTRNGTTVILGWPLPE